MTVKEENAALNETAQVTLPQLFAAREARLKEMADAKARAAVIDEEIYRRLEGSAKQAFEQAGKSHGQMKLPLQDGLAAEVKIDRKVDWDSAKLQAVAQTLPWERVAAMFKIAFSMPEAIYKGVSALDPELRKKIDDARTETFGVPKITLVRADG
jgi:hypothetical protein